ncbi:MAG: hypothetical protein HWD61_14435 [Parachlamydiaceae bacterium]|nr:MAG: hypothetical protein HWD61_14435 [Parachlamydiaceae bacterium]
MQGHPLIKLNLAGTQVNAEAANHLALLPQLTELILPSGYVTTEEALTPLQNLKIKIFGNPKSCF